MGFIDDIGKFVVETGASIQENFNSLGNLTESISNPDKFITILNKNDQGDPPFFPEDFGDVDGFTDIIEELILATPQVVGQITPENVEQVQDDVETNAVTVSLAGVAANLLVEVSGLTQVESHQFVVSQIVSAVALDGIIGREVQARVEEGIDPALKQKVHAEHRSKQADFIDFTEANVRTKRFGGKVEPRTGDIPQGMVDLLHPDDLGYMADPDTYGTIPDQTPLYELDALEVSEPEEIIEEPIQYGIPVPKRPVEQITELSGRPEDVKAIYREVIEQLPKSENLIRDYIRLTEFTFELRQALRDGRADPQAALKVVEPELRDLISNALPADRYREEDRTAEETVDQLAGELGRNFALIDSLPDELPSDGDLQAWFEKGVIDSKRFERLYKRFGPQDQYFEEYLRESAVDQGPESVQRQFLLDRITASEARLRLGLIGFTSGEAAEILSGTPPESILTNRQENVSEAVGVPLAALPEIGDQRASLLRSVGIQTVADVANASVETLTANTTMSDDEAQTAINAAQQVVQQQAS